LVAKSNFGFALKRILNTFKLLFKNKMAIFGVIILAGFVFAAVAAPLLSPYGPKQQVSGRLAQPEWVTNFPDGYYLSKNVVAPSTSAITSPSSIQSWTLTATTSTLANVQESYAPIVHFNGSDSKGSLRIAYTGDGPGTVSLSQTFQYPYHGPPYQLVANIKYLLTGANATAPVWVRVFIQRSQPATLPNQVPYQNYYLWNRNETLNSQWLPGIPLDSNNQAWVNSLRLPSAFGPQSIIFSSATSYTYGVLLTFFGHQTVNIDNLQLQLYGTAWGLLGTTHLGYDVYTQAIYGARISLFVGLLAAGIGIGLGLVIGLLAGFLGRIVDEVLMRFTDMMLVIPALPLLIVLVAVLGANIWNVIIIIGFLGWMGFARIVRSQVLTLRERPFIEAAKASGAGPGRIIVKHVFPNIVSLTYVNLALSVPGAILTESALAFLGLSDPSVVSWGNMFQDIQVSGNLASFPPTWWWVLPPGFGIALVSLSFVLIGYALDEVFNPRLRQRR
jgi:ABC-type dipeptide/oligopeptide/nickel transport system permease subunit